MYVTQSLYIVNTHIYKLMTANKLTAICNILIKYLWYKKPRHNVETKEQIKISIISRHNNIIIIVQKINPG